MAKPRQKPEPPEPPKPPPDAVAKTPGGSGSKRVAEPDPRKRTGTRRPRA